MRAQMLFGMLVTLAIAVASAFFVVLLLSSAGGAYSKTHNTIESAPALGNAIISDVQPYAEFHIITTNS